MSRITFILQEVQENIRISQLKGWGSVLYVNYIKQHISQVICQLLSLLINTSVTIYFNMNIITFFTSGSTREKKS